LLDTLRTGGSSARIRPDEDMDEDQKRHYDKFRERLDSGDMVSSLCSSGGSDIASHVSSVRSCRRR
jgi:hypothetical protein